MPLCAEEVLTRQVVGNQETFSLLFIRASPAWGLLTESRQTGRLKQVSPTNSSDKKEIYIDSVEEFVLKAFASPLRAPFSTPLFSHFPLPFSTLVNLSPYRSVNINSQINFTHKEGEKLRNLLNSCKVAQTSRRRRRRKSCNAIVLDKFALMLTYSVRLPLITSLKASREFPSCSPANHESFSIPSLPLQPFLFPPRLGPFIFKL
jgi:hypothetical protein